MKKKVDIKINSLQSKKDLKDHILWMKLWDKKWKNKKNIKEFKKVNNGKIKPNSKKNNQENINNILKKLKKKETNKWNWLN